MISDVPGVISRRRIFYAIRRRALGFHHPMSSQLGGRTLQTADITALFRLTTNLTIYIIRDVKNTLDTLFGFYAEVVRHRPKHAF